MRAELGSLLTAESAAGDRFELAPELPATTPVPDGGGQEGGRIGSYRVIREVGRGGMGAVYEAVREDAGFTKRAAIKMVRVERDSEAILRRFHYERRILARLEHRNIAGLLDGGVTADGRPYFAMEYVEGERIDRYCERLRLPVQARLQLMRQVCAAVQYAHQHLVVHRDLKPGNILVAPDGTVKLLDFGIAKLIDPTSGEDGLTEPGTTPMTASYASPEQLRGEPVNTATDIYSLGVVLYELLAGRPPFPRDGLSEHEFRRRMLEDTPAPPSQAVTGESARLAGEPAGRLRRQLAGELDQIILMALRKEPERRYTSAEELAGDLARFMAGLPVHAQPDTVGYRVRKFVGRNRTAVAAVLLLFVALVGGLGASMWQAGAARRERLKAEAVSEFLQRLLLASSPDVAVTGKPAPERTVNDVLDAAAVRLEAQDLSGQPDVKATLQRIIGRSYLSQGRYQEAEKNLRAALASQERQYGVGSRETLEALVGLAGLALARADYAEAERIADRHLAILRREQQAGRLPPASLALALSNYAVLRRARGDSRAAEGLLREALALRPSLPEAEQPGLAQVEATLALTWLDQGKFDEAEPYARRLVAEARQDTGPEAGGLSSGLTLLGSVLMEEGELPEADAALREAETLYRKVHDPNFIGTYDNLRLQAQVRLLQGRLPEAALLIDSVLTAYRAVLRPEYISFATALTVKGAILTAQNRAAQAEPILRQALELRTRNLPAGHFMTALTRGTLGEALLTRRRYQDAEPLLLESYRDLKAGQAGENPRIALARDRLVRLYTAWNRPDRLAALR